MTDPKKPDDSSKANPRDDEFQDPLDSMAGDDKREAKRDSNQKDGAEKPAAPTAETKGKEDAQADGLTSRIKDQTTRMRQNTPRQYRVGIVLGVIGVIGVGGILFIAFRDGGASRTSRVSVKPTTETAADVDAKFKVFMANQKELIPKLVEQIKEIESRQIAFEDQLKESMKANETQRAADAKFLREEITRFAKLVDGGIANKTTSLQSGDFDSFIQILAGQKTRSGLTLEEARLRLETWLGQNGFKDNSLELMRDKGLDRLGFLYVGNVAEPALTDAELEAFPEKLRALIKQLAKFNEEQGHFQGLVVFREDESLKWFKRTAGQEDLKGITIEELKKGAYLARVRKANVTKEMEEVLPDLAAQRDAKGIAPNDLFRTEAFVYSLKSRWPAMTPGQHLSLAMSLAGLRANASSDLNGKLREPTTQDKALIVSQAMDAVRNAQQQGITDQGQLITRARNAITSKAADLRVLLKSAEQEQIVLSVVADVLKSVRPQAEAAPTPPPIADKPEAKEPPPKPAVLRLGTLELTKELSGHAGLVAALVVCDRLKITPDNTEGVGLIAALFSAGPDVARQAWIAHKDRDGDLRAFTKDLYTELHGVLEQTRTVLVHRPEIPGLPPEESAYLGALEIGRVIGGGHGSETAVINSTLKRRFTELATTAQGFRLPGEQVKGWDRFLAVWGARKYELSGKPERVLDLISITSKQLVERKVAHEQIVTKDFGKQFQQKIIQTLTDDLTTSLPVLMANRDDGKLPVDLLNQVVISGHNYFAAASLAEAMLTARGINLVAEKYASLVDQDDMIAPLFAALAKWVPDHVHEVMAFGKPEVKDSAISAVASDTTSVLNDRLEQFLVKTIIANNLEPRIKAKAGTLNQAGYQKAMAYVSKKLESIVIDPLTVRAIEDLTMELHQDALEILVNPRADSKAVASDGRSASSGRTAGGTNANTKPGFFDVKDEGLPGIAIGMRKEVIHSGKVFGVPAGSAMQVYLEIGQDVPIKGGKTQDRVQLRCRGGFFSPGGTWFAFPPCVLQGTVKPNPGGDRNMVEINKMIVEINGIAVEKDVVAIVTDEDDGIAGMKAQFQRHYDKILPEAAVLSLTSGLAEGLAATQDTTTVVVPGATTQATATGNAFQYGVGEGLLKGATILEKYQEGYLDEIGPTLKTWNGQKLVAQFFSTVEYPEVSEADWNAASQSSGQWNGF